MKKCILIDVENKEVREVTIGSGIDDIYTNLKCSTFEVVNVDEVNSIYVDEEGLLYITPETKFFKYKGVQNPISGNGLIMGCDYNTGRSINTTLSLEEVKKNVKFMTMDEVVMEQYYK